MAKSSTNKYNDQSLPLVWDRLENVDYPGEHPDIFGHDKQLELLANLYQQEHLHHSWLITGPRGIGKATFSLAIAGHILRNPVASDAPSQWTKPDPANPVFSQISKRGHPNILHLAKPWDAKTKKFKSTLTIDEVRRTNSFFGTTAGEDNWRICIVDTADDMNTNAANGLLKILEEPPARTLFFLLSNRPGNLLPTIRSRCRHLPLHTLEQSNFELALEARTIALSELDEVEKQELFQISAGSVRKGILLLEQDGIALFQRFKQMINLQGKNHPDWSQVHKLADELSRIANLEKYHLLFEFAQEFINKVIHQKAQNISFQSSSNQVEIVQQQKSLSHLAHMCEVWEKTSKSARVTEDYNLDKKQVILNLFGSLANAL